MTASLLVTILVGIPVVLLVTSMVIDALDRSATIEQGNGSLKVESHTETRTLEYKVTRFRYKKVIEPVQVVYLCASDIRHEIGFVRLHDPDFDNKHAALVVLAEDRIATLQAHSIAA